jgi:hypothetical protein
MVSKVSDAILIALLNFLDSANALCRILKTNYSSHTIHRLVLRMGKYNVRESK